MPYTEAQKNATLRYKQKSIVRVILDLNRNNPEDMAVYDRICEQDNRTEYLKDLVKKDIKGE